MKILLRCGLVLVLLATVTWASDEKKTEAQRDGFDGPVRTVSSRAGKAEFELDQKDWPLLVEMGGCKECEYDRQGTLIRYGDLVEGQFRGERYKTFRDEQGNIIEQMRWGWDDQLFERMLYGPYGITERTQYVNGEPKYRSQSSYDSKGHLLETVQYDVSNQKVEGRTVQQTDASGNIKETWYYGSKGELLDHTVDTYVLKTDLWTWTNYAENGSVKVAIETQDGRVRYYRQNGDGEKNPLGEFFSLDRVATTQHRFRGHADGTSDDIETIYADDKVHNPRSMEWRDGKNTLRLKVEYDYELDGQGNWTTRRTWVWTPELSEKRLYLVDQRTLTYWGN